MSSVSASRPEPWPVLNVADPSAPNVNWSLRNLITPKLPKSFAATVRSSTLLISITESPKILGTVARTPFNSADIVGEVPIAVGLGVTVKSAV